MESRRTFLKKGSLSLIAMQIPFAGCSKSFAYGNPRKIMPETAAIIWYSQTGNTERTGKLIAKILEKNGIKTVASEYRDFDRDTLGNYDIVIAGSPVYYYDVPSNFKDWLNTAPNLNSASIASFVTFGGEGGNQHNTSRTLAGILADKGGIPVGAAEFGNMSTFAITWSSGNGKRVLKYKDKPDTESFNAIRNYTAQVLERIKGSTPFDIDKDIDFRDMIKNTPSIWGTKLCINKHTIDTDKCIGCGVCTDKCPVDAIDIKKGTVNDDKCIACLGCVNNCPAMAIDMEFLRKKVYGFNEFLKRNEITISEPKEFLTQLPESV